MATPELKLSIQQSILMDTDGTVTDLVRHFTGENIHVTKLSQDLVVSERPALLNLTKASRLLHRRILLSGEHRHYLYAESYFVIDSLSDYLRKQLLESDVPIGLLWQQEKLETFREIVAKDVELDPTLAEFFTSLNEPRFLSRTYRVWHKGAVLGVITEKFPASYFVD